MKRKETKMSMSWKRKFEIRDHALHTINSIYKKAIESQYNQNELLYELEKSVWEYIPNNFPQYMKEYIKGYERCWNNRITYELMEFCYVMDNGLIVSIERNSERYYENFNISVVELTNKPNGRYWRNSDKLYFG